VEFYTKKKKKITVSKKSGAAKATPATPLPTALVYNSMNTDNYYKGSFSLSYGCCKSDRPQRLYLITCSCYPSASPQNTLHL